MQAHLSQESRKRAERQQSTEQSPEGADNDGRNGKEVARGSVVLVHGRLAAEKHLLARRKTIAVGKAARMPIVSAEELQADREAATQRGGYVDRSLEKMQTAKNSFSLSCF